MAKLEAESLADLWNQLDARGLRMVEVWHWSAERRCWYIMPDDSIVDLYKEAAKCKVSSGNF
jgi:hypothetical protein